MDLKNILENKKSIKSSDRYFEFIDFLIGLLIALLFWLGEFFPD